jgi:ketosteroid isomerase-like protein
MTAEDDLALVGRSFELFNRGAIDEWLDLMDPHIEVSSTVLIDAAQIYRGHEGLLELVRISFEDFDEVEIEVVRIEPVGGEVVVETHVHGRGKGSGLPVSREVGYVLTLRDGMIVRILSLPSWEEAREAAMNRP